MRSPTLLLIARSLRVRMRDPWLAAFRLLMAAALLWATWRAWAARNAVGAAGRDLFEALTWVNLAAVPLLGVSAVCTAFVEARRERASDLLRLAGIDRVSAFAGQALADLSTMGVLLGLQLPLVCLLPALGGVTPGHVAAAAASLSCYVVFVWGVAMLCSTTATSVTQAIGRAATVIALVVGTPILLVAASDLRFWGPPPWADWLAEHVVALGLHEAASSGALLATASIVHLGIGLAAIALSLLCASSPARAEAAGTVVQRRRRARPGLWTRAFWWEQTRDRRRGPGNLLRWLFYLGAAGVGVLVMAPAWAHDLDAPWWERGRTPTSWRVAVAVHGAVPWIKRALLLDLALIAGRAFVADVRSGTLVALATLPSGLVSWYRVKVMSTVRQILPGLLLLSTATLLQLMAGLDLHHDALLRLETTQLLRVIVFAAILGVTLWFAAWLSLMLVRGAGLVCFAAVATLDWMLGSAWIDEAWLGAAYAGTGTLLTVGAGAVLACLWLRARVLRRLRAAAAQ